jgi:hypothetical protein
VFKERFWPVATTVYYFARYGRLERAKATYGQCLLETTSQVQEEEDLNSLNCLLHDFVKMNNKGAFSDILECCWFWKRQVRG